MSHRDTTDEETGSVSLRLREIRKARKFSQACFARILGVTTSTYWKYEHHTIPITAEQLAELARKLAVPIEEFYARETHDAPNGQEHPHA